MRVVLPFVLAIAMSGCLFGSDTDQGDFGLPAGAETARLLLVGVSEDGATGRAMEVTLAALPGGNGTVNVLAAYPAGPQTTASLRTAAHAAASLANVAVDEYDYYLVLADPSVQLDGPSAGSQFALAFYVALHNLRTPTGSEWVLPPHVAGTGAIDEAGRIGFVGGVPAKGLAAARAGATLFSYPASHGVGVSYDMRGVCGATMECVRPSTLAELADAMLAIPLRPDARPIR